MAKRNADTDDAASRSICRKMNEAPSELETTKIEVGLDHAAQTPQVFYVRTDLLTKHSEYSKAALAGPWKESQNREVKLGDVDPEVFKIFKNFVCEGNVYSSKEGDRYIDKAHRPGFNCVDREWGRLNRSWLLGQRIMSTSFKDAITDAIKAKLAEEKWTRPIATHAAVYPGSSSASGIRHLVVDIAVWRWSSRAFDYCGTSETDSEFLKDVATALKKRAEAKPKAKDPINGKNKCLYHEHITEDKPCYTTMF